MSAQVITIAQQKGGSGKTTLAVCLATELLARGKCVGLLDTDPQGSLGKWFMTRCEKYGEDENLRFSTATSWGVSYELRSLGKPCDVIIVDTPPKADSDLRPALREADLLLVPVSASHVDVWATQDVLEMAGRVKKDAHIVQNRTRAGTRLGVEVSEVLKEFDAKVLSTTLGNRVIFAETLGQGLGVGDARRNAAAVREVTALVDEVVALL